MERRIFTIGHSTRSFEEFLGLLQSFGVQTLADIRTYPGSKRYPHFNKEVLAQSLEENNIRYVHIAGLGGRKRPAPDSHNTAWNHKAFRGYADYMETPEFAQAINLLQTIADKHPTAYMCSEAVWWSCHRALVSDYLKINGWKVMHIMSDSKSTEHPFTSAARIVHGELSYRANELF
jgi:uncharacterized protein (DUF488 family)